MKGLTLKQPYASLIACGVKTIETRPQRTAYRGPLAIHAGLSRSTWNELDGPSLVSERVTIDAILDAFGVVFNDEQGRRTHPSPWFNPFENAIEIGMGLGKDDPRRKSLPLGAVVAVANLVDCIPIVDDLALTEAPYLRVTGDRAWMRRADVHDGGDPVNVTDQLPFGWFYPGRWAWVLSDIRPLPEPVPCRGYQGMWELSRGGEGVTDVEAAVLAQLKPVVA